MDAPQALVPFLEDVDDPRVELVAALAEDLRLGLLPASGVTVRPVARHRVERVGHGEDARPSGISVVAEPVRVAGAVPALVVVPDDLEPLALEQRDAAQELLAEDRVVLEEPLSVGDSSPFFWRMLSGIPILPMSWSRNPYSTLSSSSSSGSSARASSIA